MKYSYVAKKPSPDLLGNPNLPYIHPASLAILVNRGYDTEEKIKNLLEGSLDTILHGTEMKDCDRGVARLEEAITRGEHIVIYRDYDCDGCCAGAIAMECLQRVGANVTHYGNLREVDGYGICKNGIDTILDDDQDAKLILTVDNGIVAFEAIDYAVSRGLDVIVTDHHLPSTSLPRAVAIINPKREDEVCTFRDLCGAGVIFKVMISLYRRLGRDITPVLDSLDLVATATVADVVPMLGENRILVNEGIKYIKSRKRPFFSELLRQKQMQDVSAHSEIAFQIAPLVNAVSRMGENTNFMVESFLSQDANDLNDRVAKLIDLNANRKTLTEDAMTQVVVDLEEGGIDPEQDSCILVVTHGISSGIVGIVAGRLTSNYQKVSGVFHKEEGGILKGSMRGVDDFHIKDALDKISEGVLLKYGGHSKAAGLSVSEELFPQFVAEFTALIEEVFTPERKPPSKPIDFVIQCEDDCNESLVNGLKLLEPFGECFPSPIFGMTAQIVETRYLGETELHVKYKSSKRIEYIHWHYGPTAREKNRTPCKFVGFPEMKTYNNYKYVSFNCEYQE